MALPTQQLFQYLTVLENLLQFTPSSHSDFENLNHAVSRSFIRSCFYLTLTLHFRLKQLIELLNQATTKKDQINSVKDKLVGFTDWGEDLRRSFLREGEVGSYFPATIDVFSCWM